jgi:hypothetical protein
MEGIYLPGLRLVTKESFVMKNKKAAMKENKTKITQATDATFQRIAMKGKPNMQIAEPIPETDEPLSPADATVPEQQSPGEQRSIREATAAKPPKKLHMVVMETKTPTDARTGRRRRTVIVDDEKIVGEEG